MTGNRKLFTKLKIISTKCKVKTSRGHLNIKGIGTVWLIDTHHSKITLVNVLYVPDLGVNLVSVHAMCDQGLVGFITHQNISFYHKWALILRAVLEGNLYVVKWFTKAIKEYALAADQINDLLGLREKEKEVLKHKAIQLKKQRKIYDLWHQRMCHTGASKLWNLHEITDLETPIPCNAKSEYCKVCNMTKIKRKSSKNLSQQKDKLLDLVSIDIYSLFLLSINKNHYFIKLHDNHSRKG
jgi:hypothetical protein